MSRKYLDMDYIISIFDDTLEMLDDPRARYDYDGAYAVKNLLEGMRERVLAYINDGDE